MTVLQALILGIIQGLTEFLPVSSSGHLEIGQAFFGIGGQNNLEFDLVVHVATVLSTIVIFRKEILGLLKGFSFSKWNDESSFIAKILISALPVIFVGMFLKDSVESLFGGKIVFVGFQFLITAALLLLTGFVKKGNKEISYFHAFIIGIAQAIAIIPAISRSGATISAGLLLGIKKELVTRFSFLMVIIPIIGAFGYDILKSDYSMQAKIGIMPLLIGFIAAFLIGLAACKWMIELVKRGKLIYFAVYCFIIGLIVIFAA